MTPVRGILRRALRSLRRRPDHVERDGSILPAPDRRWCGPEFRDDAFYLASAEGEARRLVDELQCTHLSRVLDVGCGQGRLAIGLARVLGAVDYLGVDIHRPSIAWCRRHIQRRHPSFRFLFLDLRNDRYNPRGGAIDGRFRFPLPDASADIVYLYSVFSHTTEADMRAYLREFARILAPGGRLFFTGFVEDDVPDVSINPDGYRLTCAGPLHVVRYERRYLFDLVAAHGFTLRSFVHGTEADGQSAVQLVTALS